MWIVYGHVVGDGNGGRGIHRDQGSDFEGDKDVDKDRNEHIDGPDHEIRSAEDLRDRDRGVAGDVHEGRK